MGNCIIYLTTSPHLDISPTEVTWATVCSQEDSSRFHSDPWALSRWDRGEPMVPLHRHCIMCTPTCVNLLDADMLPQHFCIISITAMALFETNTLRKFHILFLPINLSTSVLEEVNGAVYNYPWPKNQVVISVKANSASHKCRSYKENCREASGKGCEITYFKI